MAYAEVFQALGGGLVGLLGVAVLALAILLLRSMNARLSDRDEQIKDLKADLSQRTGEVKELTAAVNRQTDVIAAWTPEEQRRLVRR